MGRNFSGLIFIKRAIKIWVNYSGLNFLVRVHVQLYSSYISLTPTPADCISIGVQSENDGFVTIVYIVSISSQELKKH